MAYRIRFHAHAGAALRPILAAIQAATKKAGFRIGSADEVGHIEGTGPQYGSHKRGYVVEYRQIRLAEIKARPSFGTCKTAFLQWEDWITFHEVVNDVLDSFQCDADITTAGAPVDKGKLMYCRLCMCRRLRYDWAGTPARRVANYGSRDQFGEQWVPGPYAQAAGRAERKVKS